MLAATIRRPGAFPRLITLEYAPVRDELREEAAVSGILGRPAPVFASLEEVIAAASMLLAGGDPVVEVGDLESREKALFEEETQEIEGDVDQKLRGVIGAAKFTPTDKAKDPDVKGKEEEDETFEPTKKDEKEVDEELRFEPDFVPKSLNPATEALLSTGVSVVNMSMFGDKQGATMQSRDTIIAELVSFRPGAERFSIRPSWGVPTPGAFFGREVARLRELMFRQLRGMLLSMVSPTPEEDEDYFFPHDATLAIRRLDGALLIPFSGANTAYVRGTEPRGSTVVRLEAWLNLGPADQKLHYVPGPFNMPHTVEQEQFDFELASVVVPPLHMVVYHSLSAVNVRAPEVVPPEVAMRLYMGASTGGPKTPVVYGVVPKHVFGPEYAVYHRERDSSEAKKAFGSLLKPGAQTASGMPLVMMVEGSGSRARPVEDRGPKPRAASFAQTGLGTMPMVIEAPRVANRIYL